MSFVSFEFALFAAGVILLYYVFPAKYRWTVLLAASMLFYGLCSVRYFLYIFFTIVTTFFAALAIEKVSADEKAYIDSNREKLSRDERKAYKAKCKFRQKGIIAICTTANFAILFFIKYANTCIAYFNMYRLNLTGSTDFIPFVDVIMPLGISFYTFQTIGYMVDVYYEKCPAQHNIFKFALFSSFFPQIVQGPISRYTDLFPELFEAKDFDFYNIKSGFYRIVWGLFKKLVIADRLGSYVYASMDFAQYYKGGYILLGIFYYAFMIYGDFSGGIDITIGVSEMLGIRVEENFRRPFFSKSISEYWSRWHITLGTWFKDYIFYPLSVNKTVLKWGKWFRNHNMPVIGKRIPIYLPMIAVWVLTGMWHGSQMRYVDWGLLNCLFIILGTELKPLSEKIVTALHLKEEMFIVKSYRVVKTFWLMSFLRLLDINDTWDDAVYAFKGVFTGWSDFSFALIPQRFDFTEEDIIISMLAILVVFIVGMVQRKGSIRQRIFKLPVPLQWVTLSIMIAAVVLFGAYGLGYDASSFVYMQF